MLSQQALKTIYLVIGQNSNSFKSYFNENKYDGLDIKFPVQYLDKNRGKALWNC